MAKVPEVKVRRGHLNRYQFVKLLCIAVLEGGIELELEDLYEIVAEICLTETEDDEFVLDPLFAHSTLLRCTKTFGTTVYYKGRVASVWLLRR